MEQLSLKQKHTKLFNVSEKSRSREWQLFLNWLLNGRVRATSTIQLARHLFPRWYCLHLNFYRSDVLFFYYILKLLNTAHITKLNNFCSMLFEIRIRKYNLRISELQKSYIRSSFWCKNSTAELDVYKKINLTFSGVPKCLFKYYKI